MKKKKDLESKLIFGGWWNMGKEFLVSVAPEAAKDVDGAVEELTEALKDIEGGFYGEKGNIYVYAAVEEGLFSAEAVDDKTVTHIARQAVGKCNRSGGGSKHMRMATEGELEEIKEKHGDGVVCGIVVEEKGSRR